jgi:hypoxanthine-guanine phosphoribosyltransferase
MTHLDVEPYITEAQIQKRLKEIGGDLTKQFKNKKVVAICVLKGSFIFYSDLIRNIETDVACEFFGVSSYQGMSSSGEVKVTLDLSTPNRRQACFACRRYRGYRDHNELSQNFNPIPKTSQSDHGLLAS